MGSVYKDRKGGPREVPTGRGGPARVELELNCIVLSHTCLPGVCVSGRSGGMGGMGTELKGGS